MSVLGYKVSFNNKQRDFFNALKSEVDAYFEKNGLKKTGNWKLYAKTLILIPSAIGIYITLMMVPMFWAYNIALWVLFGLNMAAIGFNVMHDGGHGSFSNSKFWNNVAAFSVNGLGASMLMWMNKHNIIHHTYTNIDGVDDDIEIKPLLRMCPTQKKRFIHRFQHIYVWFLYSLLLILWVFAFDFQKYFTKKIGIVPIKKMSLFNHIAFWFAKVFYYFIMIALPIYEVGFFNWMIGFLIMSMFAGFVLSVVFQLAHTVEETAFPTPVDNNSIENEWAIHQVQTTANFATDNKLVCWLVGGLNFQIEHHLFPKISHIHYPAISKIIKNTCEEFNIKYIEFKRTRDAILSHTLHLKRMGVA